MPTRRRQTTLALVFSLFAVGCDGQEDADRLARLGRKLLDRIQSQSTDTTAPLGGPLQSIRGNWNEMTLDARVTFRLRWDKELEGASVQVKSAGQGTVELHGTFTNAVQRQRAVTLARSTVGVTDVLDRMSEAKGGR